LDVSTYGTFAVYDSRPPATRHPEASHDVAAMVKRLTGRGVTFEKYPFVQVQEHGIWTTPNGDKVAWFKDPDGNVLSLSQHQR
jgi:hypothetical protein